MGSRTHNSRLSKLLADTSAAVAAATTKDELLSATQGLRDFEGPLRFYNARLWVVSVVLIMAALGCCGVTPESKLWLSQWITWDPSLVLLGLFMVFVVAGWACIAFIRRRNKLVPKLAEEITWRAAALTNGLEPAAASLDYLSSQFGDYHRGNYSREINYALEGTSLGRMHELKYHYYRLHYVDEQTVYTRVSDGKGGSKTQKRKVYHHYYRYSLVMDFPWIANIAVRASSHKAVDLSQVFEPTSSDFNRAFTLTGSETLACAKFAKPITLLTLLRLNERLVELNLEFSAEGLLCLSFDNKNLLEPDMPYDLATPEEFFKAIEAGISLPKLTAILSIVHELAEQHDDNFSPVTPSAALQGD